MKKYIVLIISLTFAIFNSEVNAQSSTQTIKGVLLDKQSLSSLPGVNIIIIGSDPLKGTTTDIKGRFRIENVAPGRYDLKAAFVGYKEIVIPNVVVSSGKEVELDLTMEENINSLNEVVVTGTKKNETNNDMTTVSARSFSMEEVNRYSGGRSDPSRLVANFAGVSSPNDSCNDIVIRGNSPTGVLWRIEGLDIANPNHFSTLGATGGPVSALNTNILRNSDFFTSAFPADYGNATAGVFDIGFRNGNTEKREHTIQFGALTGLEAMTEGPLKKGSSASYVLAYRYSFTGFAQQLGIPIGTTATPFYQDLSFKINSGETKAGKFTLFGLAGYSHIDFNHDKIDSTDLFADPNKDSYAKSKMGIVGLKHFIRLTDKTFWSTVLGVSYAQNGYTLDTVRSDHDPLRVQTVENTQTRYSINTYINSKINARFTIKGGIQSSVYDLNLLYKDRLFSTYWKNIWDYRSTTYLLAGYLQAKYSITENITLNAGLRSQYLALNGSNSIEPRAGLKFQLNEKNSSNMGYGYPSQMQPLDVYFYRSMRSDGTYDESNKNLGFTNSQHFVIGYDVLPFKDWRVKLEAYYQMLTNVPVTQVASSFSLLNEGASFAPTQEGYLKNKGTGTNTGVELTIEKFFSHGYYGLISASLYDSKYKGSDGIEHNTAFNGNYVYNVLAGKEFKIGKEKRNALSLDFKVTGAGGRYYTPVDLDASRIANQQVLKGDAYAFTERYADFFRLDFKVGYSLNSKKKKLSQSIFFDIQNITNNKNVFAQQYNSVTKQVNTSYQIGFFPNFIYKIQF